MGGRGPTRRVRCSPIWSPRSPTARTASTASVSGAGTGRMSLVRPRRRPRCGGWSMRGSTPLTCPVSAPPPPPPRGGAGGPGGGAPAPRPGTRTARAHARERAWAAGAAPAPGGWLHLDVDATITIDHSDNKEDAAATWKKPFGHHPLLVFLDRPEIAGGEALAALLRPGNAGSNTAADHITVLGWALESLPPGYRRNPHDPGGQKILVRSDSAGATHTFADACRASGVGYSFGYAVDARVRDAVEILNTTDGWYPAIDSSGGLRDGAWVAEATHLVDISSWPAGTRLILRKEALRF